jgi:hypothetical protein
VSQSADGTVLTGTGIGKSITLVRSGPGGVTTVMNTTRDQGTATDQDGNTYVFSYSNSFRVSNSAASPETFTGLMTDHFSSAGSGPATLSNGFVAAIQTDFITFNFDVMSSHGDPLTFPEGSVACDPL